MAEVNNTVATSRWWSTVLLIENLCAWSCCLTLTHTVLLFASCNYDED